MLKRKPALKLVPKVDREFAALIAPLSAEERQQLEANLIGYGCRDALVVWPGLLLERAQPSGNLSPPRNLL
jgi:hypothetical protein